MLVLLSSGATRRYRDDIMRVLALPPGAELQFRYDRRYIDTALLARMDARTLRNEPGIVLYLWSDKEKLHTECVPCRLVTVVKAEFTGSSGIVRLRTGAFVKNLDDAKLRSVLNPSEKELLPKWEAKSGTAPALKGRFFFPIQASLSEFASSNVSDFEATAAALVRFKDFGDANSTVFYTVLRLADVDRESSAIRPASGSYVISSGKRYEAEVYSYVPPGAESKSAKLHVESDVELVEFPLGKSRDIDSRYDLKQFPLRLPKQTGQLSAGLRIYLTDADSDQPHSDILIPVLFRGSLFLAMTRVAFIGIGTSGPGIVAASSAGKLNFGIAVLMLFLGFLAGAGSVFTSLKKP
jgi:hypothetical protein